MGVEKQFQKFQSRKKILKMFRDEIGVYALKNPVAAAIR